MHVACPDPMNIGRCCSSSMSVILTYFARKSIGVILSKNERINQSEIHSSSDRLRSLASSTRKAGFLFRQAVYFDDSNMLKFHVKLYD